MRGISLPVNVIVIIAIGVIVLLAGIAFFMGGFMPAAGSISDTEAWSRGCGMWKLKGCRKADFDTITIPGYDPFGTGSWANLSVACSRTFGTDGRDFCWNKCCNLTGG